MSKGGIFLVFAGIGSFSSIMMIILLFDLKYRDPLEQRIQPALSLSKSLKNTEHTYNEAEDSSTKTVIEQVIDLQRKIIRDDMKDYQFPNGKYNISARNLEDLLIEENGRPVRSIIVTTWRSGSTFFGEIINAHPANFYFYEPLYDFGIITIRGSFIADKAMQRVKALLDCDYMDLDANIEHGKAHPMVFNRNTHLWKQCQAHEGLCYNPRFLSAMCKLFPFQSMKFTRLRLSVAQELLADEKFSARMVLLVRDPRGTMQSRKHTLFCPKGPDCSDPALLCADLVSNYKIAAVLRSKYPTTFRVIRYEDLVADPHTQAGETLKFFGRDFHPHVRKFLDTHTATDSNDQFGTFRNSNATPYHWRTDLEFDEVETIQRSCALAMEYWGYVPAMNVSHLRIFNPVTDYAI